MLQKIVCMLMLAIAPALYADKLVTAEDPAAILNIARGFGSAHLEEDSEGDPKIRGRIDGVMYGIYFYGCNSTGSDCDDIKFTAAWSDGGVTLEEANEWNKTKRYGVAYIDDEGDPNLDMAVNIDYGVTTTNLEDTFEFWSRILEAFEDEVINK